MNGPWLVAFLALWLVVAVLAVAVVALLRQIGVLHQRLAPMGVHFASEGPVLDAPAPGVGIDWSVSTLTVLLFTSPTCVLCRELKPSLDAFRRQYRELRVQTVDLETEAARSFEVGERLPWCSTRWQSDRRRTSSPSIVTALFEVVEWRTHWSRSRSWSEKHVSE